MKKLLVSLTLMSAAMPFAFYKKEFAVPSGVKIINNDNDTVEIKKEDKTLDLQKELTKYFDKDRNRNDLVQGLIDYNSTNSDDSIQRMSRAANNIARVSKKCIELLNYSTILRVYTVMKNEKGLNSVIWGLAQNNDTKENFHWIIDLETINISDLFN